MKLSSYEFVALFSISFLLTSAITPIMRFIALRLDFTDRPNQIHKTHREPVPYLGGLAIVLSTISVTYGAIILTKLSQQTFFLASTIILPAISMAVVGLIDDIRQLKPWPRFLTQNLLALFVATSLVATETLGSPVGILALDFALTMLWLVGISNSINFFDNIDGGASGTIAISSLALAMIAQANGQVLIAAMSAVLAGATIGFLIWNKPPARIYMGDAGSLFLGILIASLTIRLDSSPELGKLGLLIPIFLLAVPILDTSVAVIKRIVRGVSPFQGGKDHLSHRLVRLGLKKRIAVLTLWGTSLVFGLISIYLSRATPSGYKAVMLFGIILWVLLFAFFVMTKDED